MLDSSSAVRDAAVELIGKYMIESPEFAADYFQKIVERIAVRNLGLRYELSLTFAIVRTPDSASVSALSSS